MNLDYIEQISLKFHIEQFMIDNIDEQYRFQNYIIELSQSDKYLNFHLINLNLTRKENRITKSIYKPFYNFDKFLFILDIAEKEF